MRPQRPTERTECGLDHPRALAVRAWQGHRRRAGGDHVWGTTTCAINGLTRDQLVAALATERARGKDIKGVWSQWAHKPGKPELAEALWPTLKAKIDRCRVDRGAPVPPIVDVVEVAHHVAQRWRYLSFVLTEDPEQPGVERAG